MIACVVDNEVRIAQAYLLMFINPREEPMEMLKEHDLEGCLMI